MADIVEDWTLGSPFITD